MVFERFYLICHPRHRWGNSVMEPVFNRIDALTDTALTRDHPINRQQENEILHSVIHTLSEGVIVSDETGRFLYFNPSAKRILGIGARDAEVDEWTAVYGCYYPDAVTPFPSEKLPLAVAIQHGVTAEQVLFIRNQERSQGVFIHVSASPIKDKEGRIRGGTAIFRDITQQRLAEQSSLESESRLKAQFKAIPMPTYVWQRVDDEYVLIDFNDSAEMITNHQIQNYVGKKASQMFVNSPKINQYLRQCLDGEENAFSVEMVHRMITTGEIKDFIVHYVKLPPDRVLMHTEDVTRRKANERELRKLSNAVEQTADSVIITDRRGLIEYVNPAFEATTGYTKDEVIGQTVSLLKSGKHSQDFYSELWNTLSGGQIFKGMIINRKKDGTLYWSEQTITPMKDEQGRTNHFVSVLRDITLQRKQQEQALQIKIARDVQHQLYNREVVIPGLDISGSTIPAAETNGDYYDIFPMGEDQYGIVIGDVSGHGVGSAMIMAQTRAYLHAFIRHETDPGMLLNWLNQELVRDLQKNHFVTLILMRLDIRTKQMDYASAGHLPGYLLNTAGNIRLVMESTGIPLGFLPDYSYQKSEPAGLESGDTFMLITDGIVEARNPDEHEFGLDRALNVLRRHHGLNTREVHARLLQAVREFSDGLPQQDDLTSVIGKVETA